MSMITSRTQLNVGVEITLNLETQKFTLHEAGNCVAKDGVDGQALYSKFEDLWTLLQYQVSPMPMNCLDAMSGQYAFGFNGKTYSDWGPADDATRNMLRNIGFVEYKANGQIKQIFCCIKGLGSLVPGTQMWYQRTPTEAATDFVFTDQVNIPIKVMGDVDNGNFDYRSFFKGFCRHPGYKFKDSTLADTGKTETGAYIVNLLLDNQPNDPDTKIMANDVTVAAGGIYADIDVSYYLANQNISIGGANYPFTKIIDANGQLLEHVYTKMNYQLRQNANINAHGDAGSVNGKTAGLLMSFSGQDVTTSQGVAVINLNPADLNRIIMIDSNGVPRTHPYLGAGVFEFSDNLVGAGSVFTAFFTTTPDGHDFGDATPGPIVVNDGNGDPMTGSITSNSMPYTFDFDNNTQGGYVPPVSRPITIIASRPGHGKYTVATGLLTRSKTDKFVLQAEDDSRSYKSE